MKTKTENLLPKMLNGTVHAQFKRCGKSNCKCAGGDLHGPYYYYFFRVDGKLRKRYLKASEVEQNELLVRSGRIITGNVALRKKHSGKKYEVSEPNFVNSGNYTATSIKGNKSNNSAVINPQR